jgi:maleate isomerase
MPDVLGFRAKIGLLLPYTNTVVQPECDAMRPIGVTNHTGRVENVVRPVDDLLAYGLTIGQGEPFVRHALDRLLPCKPDIVLLGHSLDAFHGGSKGASDLSQRLSSYAGLQVVVPPIALDAALQALGGIRRIALLTPYMPPGDMAVRTFFEEAGYDVKRVHGMRKPSPVSIAETTPAQLREVVTLLDGPDVDAIVQCGTNTATAAFAATASVWLGKPVIACNVACYWYTLRQLGLTDRLPGFGDLLERC